MLERAHVVQAVAQLDQDDPDIVDHGQDHAPQVFCLRHMLAGKLDPRDLRHARDDVRHVGAEHFLDALDRRQGVLDDIVEQARGDAGNVQVEFGQQVGNFEAVDQVRLAGSPFLMTVLMGRKDLCAA